MLKLDVDQSEFMETVPSSAPASVPPGATEAERRVFTAAVAPWLSPATRAVEIGPGDGRWTARLAPLVRELVAVDISAVMLDRTRARLAGAGMTNVSFLLGSGQDLAPLPSGSFDLVFGYDVFAHIALPETIAYLAEIARVLQDGGVALLHHVVIDAEPALDELASPDAEPLHLHGREALDRMYGRFGLRIESVWTDGSAAIVRARKPADSVVPRLEQALRLAASARDTRALDDAVRQTIDLGADLARRLTALAAALGKTPPGAERLAMIRQIRRLVRG